MNINQRGFALVLALFLAIGLETAAVGGLLYTMQSARENYRATGGIRLASSAEAVVDRSLRLFRDYLISKKTYPNTDVNLKVLGNDWADIGNQTFSDWLASWFGGTFKPKFTADSQTKVNNISISASDIVITQTETTADWRRYKIAVTAHSLAGGTQKVMAETVKIQIGQLFNFSIFSNELLKITSAPDFTLQGPIFGNKEVYLFTDRFSTLTLKRAKNFSATGNPEPYVLNSAGRIYFYYPRVAAKNYLLSNNEYRLALPREYREPTDPDLAGEIGLALQGREMDPDAAYLSLASPPPFIPAKLYFMPSGFDFHGSVDILGPPTDYHIQAQKVDGTYSFLTHVGSWDTCVFPAGYNQRFMLVDRYTACLNAGFTNYSGAYDSNNPPMMDAAWTSATPFTTNPEAANPNWATQPVTTVADKTQGVKKREIPLGIPEGPSNPSGTHALIEPLTSLFAPNTLGTRATVADTAELAAKKLQSKADLNIYVTTAPFISADFKAGMDHPTSKWISGSHLGESLTPGWNFYDYRFGGLVRGVEIDIGKLMLARPDLEAKPEGVVIYVHAYPLTAGFSDDQRPHAVGLVNARRIPKGGLTVATNGRLYIRGDFNDYSYKITGCDPPSASTACFGNSSLANQTSWDNETWQVPPAGIFADSIVFLSNEWVDSYGRTADTGPTAVTARTVSKEMMVNTAVVAGILRDVLVENYTSCVGNISSCELVPTSGPAYFSCSDGTWVYGEAGVSASCQFYRDDDPRGPTYNMYFVNRNSTDYIAAVSRGLPNPAPGVRIPIYATDVSRSVTYNGVADFNPAAANYNVLRAVRAFPGVRYRALAGSELFKSVGPSISYVWADSSYYNLYTMKPGEGIEDMLGLQENWAPASPPVTLRFSGTLTIPWLAKEMRDPAGTPFYYGTSYFGAPTRKFDYNEDFATKPPPGSPNALTVEVERIETS